MLHFSSHLQTNLNKILQKCFYCTTVSTTTSHNNNINIKNVKNNTSINRPKPVWSPLAQTFNSYPEKKINFIRDESVFLFNVT